MEMDYRDGFIVEAFNAWLQGAGGKKTFKNFLKHLKLDKDAYSTNQLSKEDVKRMAKKNIDNAKRIREMDRKQREQKKKGG